MGQQYARTTMGQQHVYEGRDEINAASKLTETEREVCRKLKVSCVAFLATKERRPIPRPETKAKRSPVLAGLAQALGLRDGADEAAIRAEIEKRTAAARVALSQRQVHDWARFKELLDVAARVLS